MKFFHLSDLHIGIRLLNRDLYEDQQELLRQIVEAAKEETPDAIVIAGDIYDKAVPSAEAVTLFDWFVSELIKAVPGTEIMMISGNHDSAARVNIYRNVLQGQHLHMIGMPPMKPEEQIERVTFTDEYGEVHFFLLPFVKPSMVKAIVGVDENGCNLSYEESVKRLIERETLNLADRNVLVSHQFFLPSGKDAEEVSRSDSEIRTVGNIDQVSSEVLAGFDYAALGHIHKPMKVGNEKYRYCGTPFAYSISEAGQDKGILVVELKEKGEMLTRVIPFAPIREVRVLKGTLDEVLKLACEDYVSVILTDQVDLDVTDMQDRLHLAFPNLLEIRREFVRSADYGIEIESGEHLDAYALCCEFLKDLDEEEKAILKDVIHTSLGVM